MFIETDLLFHVVEDGPLDVGAVLEALLHLLFQVLRHR